MASSYCVYIDESGDEGFVFLPNESGSSRWLVLTAVVFRKNNDLDTVKIMQDVRAFLKKDKNKALHFRELKHEQRVPYIRFIANAKIRIVSVLIHKPSIQDPEIFQTEKYKLYRYATRLLLERVSWLCRDNYRDNEGDGTAEIIFSNRSAMSYDDLRSYLNFLKDNSIAYDVRIDWNVVKPSNVKAINHNQLAGLQIADAVASGFYYAVNHNQYGEVEEKYFKMLSSLVYRHKKTAVGYGLKFWPNDFESMRREFDTLKVFDALK